MRGEQGRRMATQERQEPLFVLMWELLRLPSVSLGLACPACPSAIGAVVSLTALNCCGVRESAAIQNILTSTKGILLAIIMAAAVVSLSTPAGREIASQNLLTGAFKGSKPGGMGPALIGALWAFDGWNDIVFMAEELREPGKLPLIIIVSLSTCAGDANPSKGPQRPCPLESPSTILLPTPFPASFESLL